MASLVESSAAEDDLEGLFRDMENEDYTNKNHPTSEEARDPGIEDVADSDDGSKAGKRSLSGDETQTAENVKEGIVTQEAQHCKDEPGEALAESAYTDRVDVPRPQLDADRDKRVARRGKERATANATARDVPPWAKSLADEGEDYINAVMRHYPHEEFPPGSYPRQSYSIEVVKGAANIAGVLQEIEIHPKKEAILIMNRYPNGQVGLTVHAALKNFKKKTAKQEAVNQKGVSIQPTTFEVVKDLKKAVKHLQKQEGMGEKKEQSPKASATPKTQQQVSKTCLVKLPILWPPPQAKKRKLLFLDEDDPFSCSDTLPNTTSNGFQAVDGTSYLSHPEQKQPSPHKRRKTHVDGVRAVEDASPISSPPIPIKSWHQYRPTQTSPLSKFMTPGSLSPLSELDANGASDGESDGSPTRAKSARKQSQATL